MKTRSLSLLFVLLLLLLLLSCDTSCARKQGERRLGRRRRLRIPSSFLPKRDYLKSFMGKNGRMMMAKPTSSPTKQPSNRPTLTPSVTISEVVFIGNSFTGGSSIGRTCLQNGSNRPDCEERTIPGNVRGFYQDPPDLYPGNFDRPPDSDTLVNPSLPYHPSSNPHLGDVPTKIKLLAEHLGNPIDYVQNTQSAMTTRSHAGLAQSNPQRGSLNLLNGMTSTNRPPYDVVVIQPQSTEYLNGATSSRVSALEELLKPRPDAVSPSVKFILQQTWPRRESTTYNQVCSDGSRVGMLEEIDKTISDLANAGLPSSFQVAPTGKAFVEFAKLACGESNLLPSGACAFDATVQCPIWFGDATGKTSLFHEAVTEEGTHQSDQIGAWLSATVLYGVAVSSQVCYVSEYDLFNVMPAIPNLAGIPQGQSIHFLISEATRLALLDTFGSVSECV